MMAERPLSNLDAAEMRIAELEQQRGELLAALERVRDLEVGGPHTSAKDGMTAALITLRQVRGIAATAIARIKETQA